MIFKLEQKPPTRGKPFPDLTVTTDLCVMLWSQGTWTVTISGVNPLAYKMNRQPSLEYNLSVVSDYVLGKSYQMKPKLKIILFPSINQLHL